MDKQNVYVSCIKINGISILPPLMTPERCLELQEYKKSALTLEKSFDLKKSRTWTNLRNQNNNLDHKYVPYDNEVYEETTFENYSNQTEQKSTSNNLDFEPNSDQNGTSQNILNTPDTSQIEIPRLVRSNSYTLENPSPILLEHLNKEISLLSNVQINNNSRSDCSIPVSLNKENISKEANDELFDAFKESNSTPSHIELITTDITVQQINITTEDREQFKNELLNIEPDDNPEEELQSILIKIPEYSEKIAELVEKIKSFKFEKCQEMNLRNNEITTKIDDAFPVQDEVRENIFDVSKKTGIMNLKEIVSDETYSKNTEIPNHRKLMEEKERKAAITICAYAKGYLVRRLMKTSRVQNLIQTIHDALMCALDLQMSKLIDEADVELHRRLIQQVSAVCYEFHDIFFVLSKREQMEIIAIDREKKRRKILLRTTKSFIDFHPKINSPLIRAIKSSTSI